MIVAKKIFAWGNITVLIDVKNADRAGPMWNIFHDQHETFDAMARSAQETELALKKKQQ